MYDISGWSFNTRIVTGPKQDSSDKANLSNLCKIFYLHVVVFYTTLLLSSILLLIWFQYCLVDGHLYSQVNCKICLKSAGLY